jgi:hypothetical protein
MSKILWAFVAACVVTISLSAQEPYPQGQGGSAPTTQAPSTQAPRTPPAAPAPSASASAADKKVTYSGCIERQPASAAAVAGAANMPFSLTNASAVGAANAPVATSGGAGAAKTYRLDGTESTLTPHVGHKVEITGTIEEQPASPSGGAGAGAAPPAPRLKVDSVKMVSTSCP